MNTIIKDLATDAALRHMSAQQIADSAGLDRKTVAAILNGETENPKLDTVQAIAVALHGEITYSTPDSRAAIKSGDVSHYRSLIASLQNGIQTREKWLWRLFVVICALIGAIVLLAVVCFIIAASLTA